ncbi:FtsK/SpoIIIE domain-containing protein [Streptomyces sp. NPDC057702]|uniref:FtsK/SpoIIIE domain-containing protein n=1 Tax=unclassified Streptomyces TaxID=2593676 RepID=UPI0036931CAC
MARLAPFRAPSAKAPHARGRALARTLAGGVTDVLYPLLVVGRGLPALASAGRGRWERTPRERRGPALFSVAACALALGLAPYGPLVGLLGLLAAAGWAGRRRTRARGAPSEAEAARLRTLYEALVPHFAAPDDPDPLYAYANTWERAFEEYAFADDGRPTHLTLRYPAYFADGEPAARWHIERLLAAKSGRGREYRFAWDPEAGRLTLSVLPALPTTLCAQRFVTGPGEAVLGFTDPDAVRRTVPVTDLGGRPTHHASPVLWRTGARSTEPHLLVLGRPGSGTTTLLRSLVLQALPHADVLVIDGAGSGGYGFLHGQAGVLAVESDPAGALAALDWAAHETERRLVRAHEARRVGQPVPEETRRPLWIVVDRPAALTHLPRADSRPGPQESLRVPLRHGRPAGISVLVAEAPDSLDTLGPYVAACARARVVLGPATREQLHHTLGAPPPTSPLPQVPPGRGFARLGDGPVYRLQVPATPDPYDDATNEAERAAVLALLPGPTTVGVAVEAMTAPGESGRGDPGPGARPAPAR